MTEEGNRDTREVVGEHTLFLSVGWVFFFLQLQAFVLELSTQTGL